MTPWSHDLAAHHLVEVVLQRLHFARQLLELGEGDHADLAVLERDRVAGMELGADAVQAEQFAGHLEAGDLFTAVFEDNVGLEEAHLDRVQGFEVLARAIERIAALDLAARGDEVVELGDVGFGQSVRETQLAQVALGTGGFERSQSKRYDAGCWHGVLRPFDLRQYARAGVSAS